MERPWYLIWVTHNSVLEFLHISKLCQDVLKLFFVFGLRYVVFATILCGFRVSLSRFVIIF